MKSATIRLRHFTRDRPPAAPAAGAPHETWHRLSALYDGR